MLHGWQVTWYVRWAVEHEAYRRQTNPDFTLSRHWPVAPAVAEEASV